MDFLVVYVLGGSVAIIAAILYILHSATARAGWPAQERGAALRASAAVLIGWFLIAVVLAWRGAFEGGPGLVPTIQYGIVIPLLVGLALLWRSRLVARLLAVVPQSLLISVQLYRALGVIFLVLYAMGRLPGAFALPAGIGDVAVGLVAPLIGAYAARDPQASIGAVRAWNLLGILDLAVAVAFGVLTSPSVLQTLAFDNPNELMDAFPMVLVPVFLVPLSILLHIASLMKLAEPATGRVAA